MSFELYSPEEVSAMMRGKVSAWTIRRLAREGKVEHVRFERGRILFTSGQIEAFIAASTKGAPGMPAEPEVVAQGFRGTPRSLKARQKS